jgi:hypothetical protein
MAMSADEIGERKPKVEEKLFQNRYLVDPGRPHIKVLPHDKPSTALAALVHVCPAGCYQLNDKNQIEIAPTAAWNAELAASYVRLPARSNGIIRAAAMVYYINLGEADDVGYLGARNCASQLCRKVL